jgi:hypothetical protein
VFIVSVGFIFVCGVGWGGGGGGGGPPQSEGGRLDY